MCGGLINFRNKLSQFFFCFFKSLNLFYVASEMLETIFLTFTFSLDKIHRAYNTLCDIFLKW